MQTEDILIVDDDPQIFNTICRCLDKQNYKLEFAQSGLEALQLISDTNFKVIISDIKMMEMDGFEFLDKAIKIDKNITRIVLSGHSDVELILNNVNQRGIDRYLPKPFCREDFILAVNSCIELYDLRYQKQMVSSQNLISN